MAGWRNAFVIFWSVGWTVCPEAVPPVNPVNPLLQPLIGIIHFGIFRKVF